MLITILMFVFSTKVLISISIYSNVPSYQISVNLDNFSFGTNFFQKNMNEKEKIEKINIKFDKRDIAMYHCIKFKSTWRTSDLGDFAKKHCRVEY